MQETLKELGYELIKAGNYWWRFKAKGKECIICETQWGRFGSALYTLKIEGKTIMTGGKLDTCLRKIASMI